MMTDETARVHGRERSEERDPTAGAIPVSEQTSTPAGSNGKRRASANAANARSISGPPDASGARVGVVTRRNLLRKVVGPRSPRLAILTAPAGSGKTTLLWQWSESERRPVVWLTCVDAHVDTALLVRDLARSMADALGPGPTSDVLRTLHGSDPLRDLNRLIRAMVRESRPALVIFDDVSKLRDPSSIDLVVTLVDQLPRGWSVAMAMRQEVPLPVARWRAMDDSLVRIGLADLVMDSQECAQLLRSLGLTVTDGVVEEVLDRTEGWPAGVYLAGLSLRYEHPLRDGRLVAGDDSLIRSYLESEILAGVDATDRDLLTCTAFVREVSGPLATAITGLADAGERLFALSRANLLVMPVDRQQRWFRYHSLMSDLLQRELEDRHADTRVLHGRAARWYADNGDPDNAVLHASLAHDDELIRGLLKSSFFEAYRDGQVARVQRWLSLISPKNQAWDKDLSPITAVVAMVAGDTELAMRALASAGLNNPDIDAVRGSRERAMLRAYLCPQGPELMRADTLRSLEGLRENWPWEPTALMLLGSAERMLGNDEAAQAAFEALEQTSQGAKAVARLTARAERALAAMGRRAWAEAEAVLQPDRHFVVDLLDPGASTGMLWMIADARLLVHRGDVRTANERLRGAQLSRPRLTWGVPWYAVRALTELAQVQLLVGDSGGARTSLAQARDILRLRPRLGVLKAEMDEMATRASRAPTSGHGGSTLTPAELRLLPLLQTYLSFKEIGQRLSISANTVKTEALSIYDKLGSSTRSEAVERAIEVGLLEDPFG